MIHATYMPDPDDQPTREEKLEAILYGGGPWGYIIKPPPVCTDYWDADDWIVYVGDNWYRRPV